jgi:hypothetical protein
MASHIRNNLGSFDMYMYTTAKSNTSTFNDYVQDQLAALTACGETTHNLLNNLFGIRNQPSMITFRTNRLPSWLVVRLLTTSSTTCLAYAREDCEEFRDFIKDAQWDWECNCHVYDPNILMNECNDKYYRLLLLSQ